MARMNWSSRTDVDDDDYDHHHTNTHASRMKNNSTSGSTGDRKHIQHVGIVQEIIHMLKVKESNTAYNLHKHYCNEENNIANNNANNSTVNEQDNKQPSLRLLGCYCIIGSKEYNPMLSRQQFIENGEAVRNGILQFLFNAVDYYGEHREIVAVAINYLDRFLLTRLRHDNENIMPILVLPNNDNCNKDEVLDYYVLASLGLAIKLYSPCSGYPSRAQQQQRNHRYSSSTSYYDYDTPSSSYFQQQQHSNKKNAAFVCSFFVPPSKGTHVEDYNGFSYQSFAKMMGGDRDVVVQLISRAEKCILFTLQWFVHPPTSAAFIHSIFELLPPLPSPPPLIASSSQGDGGGIVQCWKSIQDLAYFFAELALSNSHISCKYSPSTIAIAAISNSTHRHLLSCFQWMQTMPATGHQRHEEEDIKIISSSCKVIVERMKSLLEVMEKTMDISYEFDERIITARGLLTNALMRSWSSVLMQEVSIAPAPSTYTSNENRNIEKETRHEKKKWFGKKKHTTLLNQAVVEKKEESPPTVQQQHQQQHQQEEEQCKSTWSHHTTNTAAATAAEACHHLIDNVLLEGDPLHHFLEFTQEQITKLQESKHTICGACNSCSSTTNDSYGHHHRHHHNDVKEEEEETKDLLLIDQYNKYIRPKLY
jgi:hypothetical protein